MWGTCHTLKLRRLRTILERHGGQYEPHEMMMDSWLWTYHIPLSKGSSDQCANEEPYTTFHATQSIRVCRATEQSHSCVTGKLTDIAYLFQDQRRTSAIGKKPFPRPTSVHINERLFRWPYSIHGGTVKFVTDG